MNVQKLGKIITFVGILLILGAFGAVECETITFTRFLISIVFRIALTITGLCMSFYVAPDEQIKKKR